MEIVIGDETYDISDELASEIRERARAESGEFVKDQAVFLLDGDGSINCQTYDDDLSDRAMVERGRVSRSREYLERYDAREMARERLRRAYLKVVGDWRWVEGGEWWNEPYYLNGVWTNRNGRGLTLHPYIFENSIQATQFGTDNDADLRLVMEVD